MKLCFVFIVASLFLGIIPGAWLGVQSLAREGFLIEVNAVAIVE
jgi:hypothetical protein